MRAPVTLDVGDDQERLSRVLIVGMFVAFAALIAASIAVLWNTQQNAEHSRLVDHTYAAEKRVADLQILLERSETARRGLLLSGRADFVAVYERTMAQLDQQVLEIRHFTRDNARQVARFDRVRALLAQLRSANARSLTRVAAGERRLAADDFALEGSVDVVRAIRALLAEAAAEEARLLRQREESQRAGTRLFLAVLLTAGVLVVVVALLSLTTVRRFTRQLQASRGELRRFNASLEDQVAERTADLRRANDEIQRFAYIVSHDLRSPLVNVMGFTAELEAATQSLSALLDRAEQEAPHLVSEEARLAAREDLPEAIGFIRTSTGRMDRLINAILKLSREGRRSLSPERIDMAALVDGIGETLRHRLDDKGVTLAVERPMPVLTSDRLALEQVFGNLLDNAVKYLDPKRPGRIVVRGSAVGGRALFAVEDNGRGIDQRDHSRVFDLFRRSGVQDQPGEGIGLAHVRALTYRLGGIIDVQSELGRGTTFKLDLPLSLADQGKQPDE